MDGIINHCGACGELINNDGQCSSMECRRKTAEVLKYVSDKRDKEWLENTGIPYQHCVDLNEAAIRHDEGDPLHLAIKLVQEVEDLSAKLDTAMEYILHCWRSEALIRIGLHEDISSLIREYQEKQND